MFIEINKVQKSSGSKYRLFAIAIVCIFSISSFAQDRQSQDVLKRSVEEINKHLPITVQYGITFTTVAITENSVLETIEIEGSDVSFSTLSKNRSLMKKNLLRKYKTEPSLRAVATSVIDCNMNIVIRYVSKTLNKEFQIILSTKDLIKALSK